ncbi:MAG: hypothetical protein OHK0036_20960 [Bacteroidia bacterium]
MISFCNAMQTDVAQKYQFASKLAQSGLVEELFSFVDLHRLNLNKPFDEEENTLMHAIASCEDTQFSLEILKKALDKYEANLFAINKHGQTPIGKPSLLGNKYNAFIMSGYHDPAIVRCYFESNFQTFLNNMTEALQYKQNQDSLRLAINAILNVQTNNNHSFSIRFCTDAIAKLADFKKNYLFINPKRFQMLPTSDAQYALIAIVLDQYNKEVQKLATISDITVLKELKWKYIFDTDKAVMKKYPWGTYQLLEWMFISPDFNNEASDHCPGIIDRLMKVVQYIKKLENRSLKTRLKQIAEDL